MSNFQIGQEVIWETQSGAEKTGEIFLEVPPGVDPMPLFYNYRKKTQTDMKWPGARGAIRDHKSYLVQVISKREGCCNVTEWNVSHPKIIDLQVKL